MTSRRLLVPGRGPRDRRADGSIAE